AVGPRPRPLSLWERARVRASPAAARAQANGIAASPARLGDGPTADTAGTTGALARQAGDRRWRPGNVAGVIELDGATKAFDGRTVVGDLSFRVDAGTIVGLIGPSGSGKTTTVRMVLGVHPPDQGRVLVFGRDPRGFGVAQRQRIGYMPQHFVLYPELSVEENLDFMASCYGVSIFHRGRTVKRMLDLVELGHVRKRPAGGVSGGEQRRL